MSWLSSPKVRLALIVNGLYFISLFTPTTPYTRPRLFARARANREARPAPQLQRGHIPAASSYKLSRANKAVVASNLSWTTKANQKTKAE